MCTPRSEAYTVSNNVHTEVSDLHCQQQCAHSHHTNQDAVFHRSIASLRSFISASPIRLRDVGLGHRKIFTPCFLASLQGSSFKSHPPQITSRWLSRFTLQEATVHLCTTPSSAAMLPTQPPRTLPLPPPPPG
jgi:hypothetical protein